LLVLADSSDNLAERVEARGIADAKPTCLIGRQDIAY
jgi:hypothetical protein